MITDTLLTDNLRRKIKAAIVNNEPGKIISILEKLKTSHAGTAKTKDKRFVISEIVRYVLDNSNDRDKDYFKLGKMFCERSEDNSKEIGISIIWRGYKFNKSAVEKIMIRIADDKNWEVREYAGTAMANTVWHNIEYYDTLLKLTGHKSENVRRAVVISALGLRDEIHLDKAFRIFESLLYDKSAYVKKNLGPFILGSSFSGKYPKQTLKQLRKWSKIKDDNVKWNIIMSFRNSFGNKNPETALKFLKHYNKDKSPAIRRALSSVLNFLSKRNKTLVENYREAFTKA